MRNLLISQETTSPLAHHLGIQPLENSGRLLGLAQGLDRKLRYEKMVENIYGDPDAANRLLLKTLWLSTLDEMSENPAES